MFDMIPNRIVIDTNVCLDLFFFRDERWNALLKAMHDRALEAVTRADCRNEWLIVLGYPHLAIDAAQRSIVEARFDETIACLQPADLPPADIRLPLCKDTDDQKFLELARDARAATLLTKDKALLRLARRTAKAGLFRILHPDDWLRQWQPLAALE